jgi:hypothetical protein
MSYLRFGQPPDRSPVANRTVHAQVEAEGVPPGEVGSGPVPIIHKVLRKRDVQACTVLEYYTAAEWYLQRPPTDGLTWLNEHIVTCGGRPSY